VYQEYRTALAALGAEPLPLSEPAEGPQVFFQLLDWLLSEFEGLGEVMSVANDNAASVSFEGLIGNLLRACAVDLSKIEGDFQYVPTRVCPKRLTGFRMSRLHTSSASGSLRGRSLLGPSQLLRQG